MIALPPLFSFNDYSNLEYIEIIYSSFKDDFLDNAVYYSGEKIHCDYRLEENKVCTFWHIVTNKLVSNNRDLDIARSARIKWPKSIIELFNDNSINVWEKTKKGKKRIYFCLDDWSYLVVVEKRVNKHLNNPSPYYLVLYTAFPIESEGYKRTLREEFESCS